MGHPGTVVILAAGQGTRMRSSGPKVMQPICGRPMLGYVLDQARGLEPESILVVVGHGAEVIQEWVSVSESDPRIRFVTQSEQLGTGHAVLQCQTELEAGTGPVVVLYGDMPALTGATLRELCQKGEGASAAVLTTVTDHPRGFGRVLRGDDGGFAGVVEERDATPEQRDIREVNVGVYAFARKELLECLPRLRNENAQGEYYLTDVPAMMLAQGQSVVTLTSTDERETIGINTLAHLAEARHAVQDGILGHHMAAGVFIEDPSTTYIDHDVRIGAGTTILPCTVIRAGVQVGENCEVGPFTHLRVGTVLEDGAEVGNFTEAKKSRIGKGTKAKHLTYLGDVDIGAKANIGAGTIVANYDGKHKHKTTIGDRAFIGSGSVLVAPCHVGEGGLTGAGAVVTRNSEVPPGDVWVGVPARPISDRRNKE